MMVYLHKKRYMVQAVAFTYYYWQRPLNNPCYLQSF